MAQTIKIRRTTGQGFPSSLAQGEMAYVYGASGGSGDDAHGKKLIIGHQSGGSNTPEIIGGSYYTGVLDTATNANTANKLVLRDGSGNFSAGTITAALTGTASNAAAVTLANEGSDTTTFLVFSNDATGSDKALKTNAGLSFNSSNGTLTASTFSGNVSATTIAGTLSTAAQPNITSLGTLTTLTVDDITINGSTISDAADLTLDVGGNIEINADGGTITFKDATSSLGTITSSGYSGNAATATSLATARNLVLSGDASATFSSFDGTGNVSASLTLATVNSNVGSFGSTTAIPVVTVNGKGLVTAVSTAALSTSFTLAADSGSNDTFNNGETLTFAGGTGVATTVSNNNISIAIGQDVSTSATPTFGTITTSGELRGPATFTIDPATVGDNTGTVVIAGNLTVNGSTTTVNSNTVNIGDNILVLNSDIGASDVPSQDAGLEVDRGASANAKLQYVEGSDLWKLDVGGGAGLVETLLTSTNFNAQYSGVIDGGTYP